MGSLFFIFFNLNYLFIIIYNIILVLPYIDLNPPWAYMCSPSWTPLPSPTPIHPSGSSQCTSPKHPVSCIEPGLAIRFTYDNLHVSMPFSRIIPPLPSPTESKRLFNSKWILYDLSHLGRSPSGEQQLRGKVLLNFWHCGKAGVASAQGSVGSGARGSGGRKERDMSRFWSLYYRFYT